MAEAVLSDFVNAAGVSYFIQRGWVTINFGYTPQVNWQTRVTVSALWVTANSLIVVSVAAVATADHSPDEVTCEGIKVYPTNIVPGVSFDIVADAPNGTFGAYLVNYLGG